MYKKKKKKSVNENTFTHSEKLVEDDGSSFLNFLYKKIFV